jgi:8-oxo-dGTP pyrophosphatase MutT (NUDIX family)
MIEGEWNVVFLLDNNSPSKVVFLKRDEHKTFAGGWYTGVGGKHELTDRTKLSAAERELEEETGLKTPITHFATVIVDNVWHIYYFWGIHEGLLPECNEGTLEWLATDDILDKKIVRTTAGMVEEWRKRDFGVDRPWTMYTEKINTGEINGVEKLVEIKEGLDE